MIQEMATLQDIKRSQVVLTEEREREIVARFKPLADSLDGFDRVATEAITTQDDAERVNAAMSSIKDYEKWLSADALPEVEQAHRTHKAWCKFRDVFAVRLSGAAATIRRKLITWQQAEQAKAEAERRRLQAIEDAKTEKARQELLKKAEKAKTPEKKEMLAEMAETITPVSIVTETKKVIQTRRTWKVASVDKAALIKEAAKNPAIYSGYLEVNETALRKAKIANPELELCGVKFEQVTG